MTRYIHAHAYIHTIKRQFTVQPHTHHHGDTSTKVLRTSSYIVTDKIKITITSTTAKIIFRVRVQKCNLRNLIYWLFYEYFCFKYNQLYGT